MDIKDQNLQRNIESYSKFVVGSGFGIVILNYTMYIIG